MTKGNFKVTYIQKGKEKTIGYMKFQLLKKKQLTNIVNKNEKKISEEFSDRNEIKENVDLFHIKNASFRENTIFKCLNNNTILQLENCSLEKEKELSFIGGNVIIDHLQINENFSGNLHFENCGFVELIMDKQREDRIFCDIDSIEDFMVTGNAEGLYIQSFPDIENLIIKNTNNLKLCPILGCIKNIRIENSSISASYFTCYDNFIIKNSTLYGNIKNRLEFISPVKMENTTLIAQEIKFSNASYKGIGEDKIVLTEKDIESLETKRKMISVLKGIKNQAVVYLEEEKERILNPYRENTKNKIFHLNQQIKEEVTKLEMHEKNIEKGIRLQKIKRMEKKK